MIKLQKNADCCGCNACMQSCHLKCISMQEDHEGFLYPKVDLEHCIGCGLCEKVCPVINQAEVRQPLRCYAAKNKNEEIRRQSSSGGIFTLLAENILNQKGVVFGVRFDENWEVIHDYIETKEKLALFRGSKYVQSRIGESYLQVKQFLEKGRWVLFSGTPCQIAGLKLFLRKEYDNLLTIDFICHGVPSPKVWRMYLDELIYDQYKKRKKTVLHPKLERKDAILSINFRDKTNGWKKFNFALQYSPTIGGTQNTVSLSESLHKNIFMRGFLDNLYLRPSCYACPSKSLKSGSDITIGDLWGIQNINSAFDDDKGISAIMINTKKGEICYNKSDSNSLNVLYVDIISSNNSIVKSVLCSRRRYEFMNSINKNIINLINKNTKSIIIVQFKFFIIRIFLSAKIIKEIRNYGKKKNRNSNILEVGR
jgi:ferredoxin